MRFSPRRTQGKVHPPTPLSRMISVSYPHQGASCSVRVLLVGLGDLVLGALMVVDHNH